MSETSRCFICKNFIPSADFSQTICAAFPEGIPREILFNEVLHDKPYPGDHGIRYEAEDGFEDDLN